MAFEKERVCDWWCGGGGGGRLTPMNDCLRLRVDLVSRSVEDEDARGSEDEEALAMVKGVGFKLCEVVMINIKCNAQMLYRWLCMCDFVWLVFFVVENCWEVENQPIVVEKIEWWLVYGFEHG